MSVYTQVERDVTKDSHQGAKDSGNEDYEDDFEVRVECVLFEMMSYTPWVISSHLCVSVCVTLIAFKRIGATRKW